MTKSQKTRQVLFLLRRYVIFFLLIAFLVTCCMMLFLNTLQNTLHRTFTQEELTAAAKLTMGNVLLLSLFFTLFDGVRRHYTVDRPVRRITAAADRLMRGDFSARIEPIRSADPSDGFNVIIDDFNRMAQELSGLETLRTDFIANVSHELKTPLSVMHNYGVMLQSPKLSEEKKNEYARAICEQSRRLADLVGNILKLNRLENQRIYPAAERFDLGEQLAECLLQFESVWEKKNIEIETDLAEDVIVESDAELLSLVWNNLFSNAFKFTESGGTVSVRLKSDGTRASVEVADTGCGIPSDVGKHMFEKFYQGDTSHATQGNGLGLALVRRVTDIVGGSIDVRSEVGRGSVFTFTIRAAKAANETA